MNSAPFWIGLVVGYLVVKLAFLLILRLLQKVDEVGR